MPDPYTQATVDVTVLRLRATQVRTLDEETRQKIQDHVGSFAKGSCLGQIPAIVPKPPGVCIPYHHALVLITPTHQDMTNSSELEPGERKRQYAALERRMKNPVGRELTFVVFFFTRKCVHSLREKRER